MQQLAEFRARHALLSTDVLIRYNTMALSKTIAAVDGTGWPPRIGLYNRDFELVAELL